MSSDVRMVIGRALLAIHVAVAVAGAALAALAWLAPGTLGAFDAGRGLLTVDLGKGAALVAAWLGGGLLAADALYLLYGRRPRPPLRHILSEGREGGVLVTREAVEGGLRAAGEAVDGVSRVRVTVQQPGLRRLLVHAQFAAVEGTAIQAAGGALRAALRRQFETLVEPPQGTRVDFELEFVGFAGKAGKRPPAREDPQEPPFTGPRYPIDEDEETGRP